MSCGGKEYEIERYQGEHSNEYCVYEMKNGVRHGTAELFDDGVMKMRWKMKNGVRSGRYVLFDKGVVVREGEWINLGGSEDRVIENRRSGLVMVIRENEEVVYEGGYDEKMQRDGLGYEYEHGVRKRYGRWEKEMFVEVKQLFISTNEMIEYTNGSVSDLLSRKPIYIGCYLIDEASGLMKRNGCGRVLNEHTGVCEYESEWENGEEKEDKRVTLSDGWYFKPEHEESVSQTEFDDALNPEDCVVYPLSLASHPLAIEELTISDNEFGNMDITRVDLVGLMRLKRIRIGRLCFRSVRLLEIDGLNELESIVIGCCSFTSATSNLDVWSSTQMDGVCRIVNCPKLKSIQIGDDSFSDYHSFELSNLPSL